MHDKNSSYAINKKDSRAIIYPDGNRFVRITADNVEELSDFNCLKTWSDMNYHTEEKKNHIESNHSISLELLPESAILSIGPEEVLERKIEKAQKKTEAAQKVNEIRTLLSEKQFNRLWKSCVDGVTEEEIAISEGISQQAVSKSLTKAKQKIRKYFLLEE